MAVHLGSHLGADPLPEHSWDHATPAPANDVTCTNTFHTGPGSTRTSFGTKRSWVQIPPPRQRKHQVRPTYSI
ncbi:hypothetical protein GCM10027091_26850 [Streptomyces daliensis]